MYYREAHADESLGKELRQMVHNMNDTQMSFEFPPANIKV